MKQCLVAATLTDNHECIGKLVKMGAKNIDECLTLAKDRELTNATTMLMLMKAALTGNKSHLPNEEASSSVEHELTNVGYNHHDIIAETLHIGKVSTSYAFEVAQQAGHHSVKRDILLLKAVYRRIVDWSNLRLVSLDVQLIQRICHQLRYLNLSGNMLTRIPEEINLLSKVSLW